MAKQLNLTGRKFGKLTAIKIDYKSKDYKTFWLCKCDCGNYTSVYVSKLTTGKTKTCGCSRTTDPHNYKHGLRHTRLYRIWANMKTRCYNKMDPHYSRWGGRGVKICNEWINDFKAFYDWAIKNGYQDNLSIDRINNDGNYEPNNCRWATIKQQNNNKRNVKGVVK